MFAQHKLKNSLIVIFTAKNWGDIGNNFITCGKATALNESCKKCGRPKSEQVSGTLTQWIVTCACDLTVEAPTEPSDRCINCGRRLSKRSGSLTQWIFGSEICNCSKTSSDQLQCERLSQGQKSGGDHAVTGEDCLEPQVSVDEREFPLDRYTPIKILDTGSSGLIYLCRDRLLKRKAVLKTLRQLTATELVAFQKEAKATSRLCHPNIVTVFDFGITTSGRPYMVMDYKTGGSLRKLLDESGSLSYVKALQLLDRLCAALAYSHSCGVLHRDLKPSNILVLETGSDEIDVCLIDFGIAKVKVKSQGITIPSGKILAGTPGYMAPDEVNGLTYDERSEIYSLGCLFFESLTGRLPFHGEGPLETLAQHANTPPPLIADVCPDAALPAGVQMIVSRCLEKSPDDRFQDMNALAEAAREVLLNQPGSEDSSPDINKLNKNAKSLKVPVALALLFCSLGSLVFFTVGQSHQQAGKNTQSTEDTAKPRIPDYSDRVLHGERKVEQLFESDQSKTQWKAIANLSDADLKYLPLNKVNYLNLRLPISTQTGDVDEQPGITDDACKYLKKMPLTFLDISGSSIGDKGIVELMQIKTLSELYAARTRVTNFGASQLANSSITHLSLRGTAISDETLTVLAGLKSLKSLNIGNTQVTHRGLEKLGQTKLTVLVLAGIQINDDTLKVVSRLPLVSLDISGCKKFTSRGWSYVGSTRTITDLDAMDTGITQADIDRLIVLPLKHLDVSNCSSVNDTCLDAVVRNWPALRHLYLNETKVSANGIRALSKLGDLERLSIARLSLRDLDLEPIFKLENLEQIDLSGNPINDQTLYRLSLLPKLVQVDVLGCNNLSEKGLRALSRKKIDFHSDVVTAEELDQYIKLPVE